MVSFLILGIFTESVSNILSSIMDDVYFIPKESNIFVFKATEWNDGSGDWWIYGEDNKYYYMAIDKNHYYKLSKGQEPIKFNKFDYKTWGENKIEIIK